MELLFLFSDAGGHGGWDLWSYRGAVEEQHYSWRRGVLEDFPHGADSRHASHRMHLEVDDAGYGRDSFTVAVTVGAQRPDE